MFPLTAVAGGQARQRVFTGEIYQGFINNTTMKEVEYSGKQQNLDKSFIHV